MKTKELSGSVEKGRRDDPLPLRSAMDVARHRVRLHMPGHFGSVADGEWLDWDWDLTEVEGLDILTEPSGVLRTLKDRAARAFGAGEAWISVQGATLPILAGALALTTPGSVVVAERYSHRSVMAAAMLGDWDVRWVPPTLETDWLLPLPATMEAWKIQMDASASLAIVTSPTYEGLAQAITPLAAELHAHGISLMVDAAHGSHWGRTAKLPPHPLAMGADWVAHGLHKTEPVLTQTGLLLSRPGLAEGGVSEWWRWLSTSSPSYLLLASVERYLKERENGDGGWDALTDLAAHVREDGLRQGFRILQCEWTTRGQGADVAKLTIRGDGAAMARRLRARGIEPEAWGIGHITLVMGPGQNLSREDWQGIWKTLGPPTDVPPVRVCWPEPGPRQATVRMVKRRPWQRVPLKDARGVIAAGALTPYPPGVPAVMPGETITPEWIEALQEALARGLQVEGVEEGEIWIIE